jgi:acetyltransferase-like isoleucine patch superfamily enzyme
MRALKVRLLQLLALFAPGAWSVRVWLHRWRGVTIGRDVFIGTDALIETSRPELVWVGNGVTIGARSMIVAHFRGAPSGVRIEDDVFIGPGAIILPGVTIRRGAVVTAGSVVTSTVPAMTVVQGNPARPVAQCGVALSSRLPAKEFYRHLKPLKTDRPAKPRAVAQ